MSGIPRTDWAGVEARLNQEGYAIIPGLLGSDHLDDLARTWPANDDAAMSLADDDLGRGHHAVFPRTAAPWIDALHEHLYDAFVPIANRWNEALGDPRRYPATLQAFVEQNRHSGQTRRQSHLTRLRQGDYQALHQHADGEHVFPLQVVGVLGEPGRDFTGGEFVMTEQRPRMQSRPMVLPLRRGDAAVIASGRRPHQATAGHYRVNLKHAISRVRGGERMGFELLFHGAPQGPQALRHREPGPRTTTAPPRLKAPS